MTYSRKRYWLALGGALAVAGALTLISRLYPGHVGLRVMGMPVVALCGVLAFLAYFSLDEIQRQNEMRAWYYGGLLASLFGVIPVVLLISSPMLETIGSFLSNASGMDRIDSPQDYFSFGAVTVLVLQTIGHLIAHAIFKTTGRARE